VIETGYKPNAVGGLAHGKPENHSGDWRRTLDKKEEEGVRGRFVLSAGRWHEKPSETDLQGGVAEVEEVFKLGQEDGDRRQGFYNDTSPRGPG
jgi:hypothetical protein